MATINVCGHGIYRALKGSGAPNGTSDKPGPDGIFDVPANTKIFMYCNHGYMFDSHWEEFLRPAKGDVKAIPPEQIELMKKKYSFDPDHPAKGPKGRVFNAGDECFNYRLGYGFNLQYLFEAKDGKPWSSKSLTGAEFNLYIDKDQQALQLPLKTIVERLRKENQGALVIRWYACRETVDPSAPRSAIDEHDKQTKGVDTRPHFILPALSPLVKREREEAEALAKLSKEPKMSIKERAALLAQKK